MTKITGNTSSKLITGTLVIVFVLFLGAGVWFGYQRYEYRQTMNVVKQKLTAIVIAMHEHSGKNMTKLPNHAIYDDKGNALLSWRVKLLPYLGNRNLFNKFRLNEPWNSRHNRALLQHMPKEYAHPLRPDEAKRGWTHYQVFVGAPGETLIPPFVRGARKEEQLPRVATTDGIPNTILIVEASKAVPWTKPADVDYFPRKPIAKLGVFVGGFHVGMINGDAWWIRDTVTERTLRNAITWTDLQVLGPDWQPR